MQRSWRMDGDKITFIICKPLLKSRTSGIADPMVQGGVDDAEEKMLGDVNVFISPAEDDPNVLIGELELMIADSAMQGKGYGKLALLAFLKYVVTYEGQILNEYQMWASSKVVANEDRASEDHKADQEDNRSGEAVERLVQQPRFGYLRARIAETNVRSLALFEHAGLELQSPEPNYFGELEMRMYEPILGDTNDRLATNKSGESWKDSSWKLLNYHRPTDT